MALSPENQAKYDEVMGNFLRLPQGMRTDEQQRKLDQQLRAGFEAKQAEDSLQAYQTGGAYGPERILSLFESLYNGPKPQDVKAPVATNPSISEASRYGQGAMDLAGRAAAVQTGSAAATLPGMNNYARAQALGDISRGASAGVGAAGVQGYGQGLSAIQNADLSNQSASLQAQGANQSSALNQRSQALGLFGGSVNLGASVGMNAAQMAQARMQALLDRQKQEQEQESNTWGQIIGGATSLLPLFFSPSSKGAKGKAYEPPSYA